ncbi:MAG: hypothetical protein A2X23_11135 [Chloroflexi bacterium GWC2_73_18]|nr:MAG: hypothetical protein A2X23_11135 [Chloroflexi bacterium GWC2_73_18]
MLGGPTPQDRQQAIAQDIRELHGLGYAQELFRSMGGFSNFAISFSIISILTGAIILYDYGLAWGGTAASLIGWPLVTIFVLAIAAAMAEVASAYPTAGGLYYWASKMKNKDWGWWTAWLNLGGQIAIVAGINFAAAAFINGTIIDKIFGGTFNTATFGPISGQVVTMGVLMLVQLVLNIGGIRVVAFLNDLSVWWHIVFVVAIAVALFLFGTQWTTTTNPDIVLFSTTPLDTVGSWANSWPIDCWIDDPSSCLVNIGFPAASQYPVLFGFLPVAFFFSLLQANWTYTGYDASAHVAEETIGARLGSAWGVFLSVAVSAIVGYIVLFALTLHLPDMSTLFPKELTDETFPASSQYYFGGGVAVISILETNLEALGSWFGAAIAVAMSLCGLSSIASAGRMLFAFSRDDGIPGSRWLKKVSHRYRTPANSLGAIVVFSWLFTAAAFMVGGGVAIVVVTAISTILLYAAYGVVIYLGLTTSEWRSHQVWSLGRWSRPVAWAALFWTAVLMVLFAFPTSGNISWPFMVGFFVFLLVYYYAWAKKRFMGPHIMGREAELTEIEREFEEAAEHLREA